MDQWSINLSEGKREVNIIFRIWYASQIVQLTREQDHAQLNTGHARINLNMHKLTYMYMHVYPRLESTCSDEH